MRRIWGIAAGGLIIVAIFYGCRDTNSETAKTSKDTEVIQNDDGNILLNLSDAYLLSDNEHPERNTAEWRFEASAKGRYEVWLTSFTKDTMDLHYSNPVIVTFGQKRITEKPVGNEIVLDAKDIQVPYYRADSKLGSIYIESPGHYNIQLISEKLVDRSNYSGSLGTSPFTLVKSLMLKPMRP